MDDEWKPISAPTEDEWKPIAPPSSKSPKSPYGGQYVTNAGEIVSNAFPGVRITDFNRDPKSPLGRKFPDSNHLTHPGSSVDIAPIPGISFEQARDHLKGLGYDLVEALDEASNPIPGRTTGPNWHFTLGGAPIQAAPTEDEWKPVEGPDTPLVHPVDGPATIDKSLERVETTRGDLVSEEVSPDRIAISPEMAKANNKVRQTIFEASKLEGDSTEIAQKISDSMKGSGFQYDAPEIKQWIDYYRTGGKEGVSFYDPRNTIAPVSDEIVVNAPTSAPQTPSEMLTQGGQQSVENLQDVETGVGRGMANDFITPVINAGERIANNLSGQAFDEDLYKKELEKARMQASGVDPDSPLYNRPNGIHRAVGEFIGANLPYAILPEAIEAKVGKEAILPIGQIQQGAVIGALSNPDDPMSGMIEGGATGGALHNAFKTIGYRGRAPIVGEAAPVRVPYRVDGPDATPEFKTARQKAGYVQDQIDTITEGMTNAPDFIVYTTRAAMKKAEPDRWASLEKNLGKGTNRVRGMLGEDGKVRIIAENIKNPETISSLIYHEGLGHYGLAQEFQTGLDDILGEIYRTNHNARNYADAYLKRNPEAYTGADAHLRATEEYLAKLSEGGRITKSMLDPLRQFLKDIGRKMGMDLRYSDREVGRILADAHDRVINGDKADFNPDSNRFMYTGTYGNSNEHGLLPDGVHEAWDRGSKGEDIGPGSQVHRDTDWFYMQGDKKWRREISDHLMELDDKFVHYGQGGSLGKLMKHDELFKLYPELRDVKVTRKEIPGVDGEYDPNTGKINISPNAMDPGGTLLHEIQHWVQDREGFAAGGSPRTAIRSMTDAHAATVAKRVASHVNKMIKYFDTRAEAYRYASKDPDVLAYLRADEESLNGGYERENASLRRALKKRVIEKYLGTSDRSIYKDMPEYQELKEMLHDLSYGTDEAINSYESRKYWAERDLEDLRKTLTDSGEIIDRKKLNKVLSDTEYLSYQAYQHLFGEVEARDTDNRQFKDEEQRKRHTPYTSEEDIEPSDYIYSDFYGKSLSMKEKETSNRFQLDDEEKPRVGNMSADRIRSTSDIVDIMKETASTKAPTEKQTRADTEILSELTGLTPSKLAKKNPMLLDPAVIHKARKLMVQTTEDVARMAQKIASGKGTGEDMVRFKKLLVTQAAVQEWVMQAANHAGRALNAFGMNVGEGEALSSYISKGVSEVLNNPDMLNKFAQDIAMVADNPKAVSKAARDITKPYLEDYVLSYRYAALLSNISTHVKNALGNASLMYTDLIEHGGASLLGQFKRPFAGTERVMTREVAMRQFGILRALVDMQTYKEAGKSWMEGHPTHAVSKIEEGQHVLLPGALSAPQRALAASDSFFRSLLELGDYHGMAIRTAYHEGKRGAEMWDRVDELINNPTGKMVKHADESASVLQLVSEPSPIGQWMERGKARPKKEEYGKRALRFGLGIAFPFTRVADNLFWAAVRRTPLGAFEKVNLADLKAGGAQQDLALVRMAVGPAIMTYFASKYWDGDLIGDLPENSDARKMKMATGARPNSIRMGDKWVSLDGMDSVSVFSRSVANILHSWETKKLSDTDALEQTLTVLEGVTRQMESGTFTEDIGRFLGMFDKDGGIVKYMGQTANSFVPNIMKGTNRLVWDPVVRDTSEDNSMVGKLTGAAIKDLPGFSKHLPQAYDPYGRPMTHKDKNALGVFQTSKVDTDPVVQEMDRLSTVTGKPLISSIDRGDTNKAFGPHAPSSVLQEWQQQYGSSVHDTLTQWVESPQWGQMTDNQKVETVQDVKKYWRKYWLDQKKLEAGAKK